ncbi:MAG: hypothetical protein UV74_C0013G0484 [Candidatus Woesebacteria bacterium GW2011_GWB1_43_14]|uniref:DUF4446 domain-containing protein n=1 Tax=Candidatus Woesebacteria bacterium GW2011_GWB1_43_14 TaxID=1618578 RepID=A0A0G1DIE4_9BACT|nr:MAG: hypothetical protein UT21_C0001G0196 [Candidatus Woesebacteria bacterium GW2011_GWA1_39_11b]KKS78058.1 MAG: hypothetical protein UV51_C0003G0093 [Candidatus Woesebacteria bacterium GW2011_GWC1_42_9]KKS97362.1 MAG: hypothetical protein UV74_C0013G0484 [Candidatus Woesebacteria bacterium GW2011_GWB1_43_14]
MEINQQTLLVIVSLLVLWVSFLSFLFYYQRSHYLRLLNRSQGGNLVKVLDKILESEVKNEKELANITQEIENIKKDAGFHIQKIGLVRFNPFSETGGDQSFSLAVLNESNTGIVITGLHTRDRTRVYAKPVNQGKSRYTISKEEQRAIKEAKK